METIYYYSQTPFDNIRKITCYDENEKILFELECLPGFRDDEEEIQNYLNDNGLGDQEYDFKRIFPERVREELQSEQVKLHKEIVAHGINVVNCGSCGHVLFHRVGADHIVCPHCGFDGEPCDFPDFY